MSDKEQKPDDHNEGREEPLSGAQDLAYALAEAIMHAKTKDAIADLVENFAKEIPQRSKNARLAFILGHSVTFFVVLAVGILGYLKVISSETTGVILAAIVGYLYQVRRR